MRTTILFIALVLAFAPVKRANAVDTCLQEEIDYVVNKVKDAIANAKANCPNPGEDPKEFDYVKTYDGSGAIVTRKCTVTTQEDTFGYTDADGRPASILTDYFYLITQNEGGDPNRPEIGFYTRKDETSGFYHVAFQILAGSLTDPIASCVGIIDESEIDAFSDSVIECTSTYGNKTYRKDVNGRSCY